MKRAIPNKTECFCEGCRRFHPRERIAAVKWVLGGKRASYRCKACQDRMGPRRGG